MSALRLLKYGLIVVMVCIVTGAVYVSTLIRERQQTLGEVARYNTSWLAAQAVGEFMRLEARLAALAVPGSGVDADEVQLRFDILLNRVDLFGRGEFARFVEAAPDRIEFVRELRRVVAEVEPLMARLDKPEAVSRALVLLAPLDAKLVNIASAANRFGADRVGEDQRELIWLHWAFSGFVVILLAGGIGLISLLIWHNALLARTYRALGTSADQLSRQSDEIRLVNDELGVRNGRFDAALTNMSQGLCMVDRDGRLIVCNRRFLDLFGFAPSEILTGRELTAVVEGALATAALPALLVREIFSEQQRLGASGQGASFYNEAHDGRTISVAQRPMSDGGWIATYEDVTDRRRAEAQIAYMAHHDALTGLGNRVLFREHLEQAIGRSRRVGDVFAVLCLDLDGFKDVNDTLGHPVGDRLLVAVAERLRSCLDDSDFVARLGGDEFAVLQIAGDGAHDAGVLATRIVELLSQPFELDGHQVNIGTSVGVAIGTGADLPDGLLKSADMALYRAKGDGRRTFRFFEPAMDAALQARRALEIDLRKALVLEELELYYQPIVNLETSTVSCFEALMRWHHPVRGFVPPSEFIPIAEETGLIGALGDWTLRRACEQAAAWPDGIKVAVNLSPVQFKNRGLVDTIVRALAATGLPPNRLELEITESVLLQESDGTLATLHRIRALGVRVAMDDFGTGYSSLSYLRSFPFDKIKIDQSFVRELSERSDCAAIVRSVTQLGSTLGMTTTAEGVETRQQLDMLRAAGCTEAQGYLFAKPLAYPAALAMLADSRPLLERAAA